MVFSEAPELVDSINELINTVNVMDSNLIDLDKVAAFP